MMPITYEDLRRVADMAPSILNTKPWSLSFVADDRIELRTDWRRSLKVIDPRHRQLVISCGAALFNVRMAIRVTGHDLACSLVPSEQATGDACPDCWAPGLLASVEIALRSIHPATEDEQRLYEAIPLRHTIRQPFIKGVDLNKAVELELAPHKEGVDSKLVKEQEAKRLLEEATQASRELASNEKYREELRAWTGHGVHVSPNYGVPADKLAPKPKDQRHPPVRDLGLAWDESGESQEYEKHYQLIKLTAKSDTPTDWVRMGQALQRLLLTATRYGVQASLLTQQFESDDIKRTYKLTNPWWPSPRPTMVVRLGHASDPGHPSRSGAGETR